jgi:CheY-like chemotaxis protein
MLRRVVGEDIELSTALAPALANVQIDPGSFEQVIMNLAVNARDAMPGGGKLAISTGDLRLDDAGAQDLGGAVPAGPYVVVAVADEGSGMDQATLSHIFEPFYTTKSAGQGTGLGLSTCYGIVKQAGGHIWVDSAPGKGTTFRILLPSVEAQADAARPSEPPTRLEGSETILLVEDDDQIRKLALRALTSRGYRVVEARNGRDALRARDAWKGRIDLLLADVVMPEMGGKELAERLTAAEPGVKVLYMSGYTPDAIVHRGVEHHAIQLLAKPFTPEVLLRVVREVLDE